MNVNLCVLGSTAKPLRTFTIDIEFDVEFDEEYTGGSSAPTDAETTIIYNGAWTVFDFAQFPYFSLNHLNACENVGAIQSDVYS